MGKDGHPKISRQFADGESIATAAEVSRALNDAARARFRKFQTPFDAESQAFIDALVRRFAESAPGEIVTGTRRGVTVTMPKLAGEHQGTVTYKNDEALFARLCYKIALEAAALALGTATMLSVEYDEARSCARYGGPLPAPVHDVKLPPQSTGDWDANLSHEVAVFDEDGRLRVQISFFRSYMVEAGLGPAVDRSDIPTAPDALKRSFDASRLQQWETNDGDEHAAAAIGLERAEAGE